MRAAPDASSSELRTRGDIFDAVEVIIDGRTAACNRVLPCLLLLLLARLPDPPVCEIRPLSLWMLPVKELLLLCGSWNAALGDANAASVSANSAVRCHCFIPHLEESVIVIVIVDCGCLFAVAVRIVGRGIVCPLSRARGRQHDVDCTRGRIRSDPKENLFF